MTGRAPFPWFGGKQSLVPALLELLPPHHVYLEAFGGAASLLCSKRPSKLEVYNDLDSGLVNFFRVLRDQEKAQRLCSLLELTPCAREEYLDCREHWQDATEDVERARRWFVQVSQGFSAHQGARSGWGYSLHIHGGAHRARKYRTQIAALEAFSKRWRHVQVDHLPALEAIQRYDAPDTLVYADPPYLPDTRRGGGYRVEMTRDEHRQLLEALHTCASMVVLSGYDSALYREMLPGWDCRTTSTLCWSANSRVEGPRPRRRECVWIKPNATRRQLELGLEVSV